MSGLFSFVVLGISTGAIYGLAGLGLVLIHKGSKVVNFAQGAFALLGAIGYYELTLAGIPKGVAILLSVPLVALCGAAVELLLMRRMERVSTTTKVISTVALLLVIQSAVALIYGGVTHFVPAILPTNQVAMLGTSIGLDRLLLVVIGVALAVGLRLVYKHTTFGLATIAAAENRLAASSLGYAPRRLALVNWMLGSGLAALAGVLIAPIVSIDATALPQLVFPAVAAALIGRFSSFAVTFATALVLGVAQSLSTRYISVTGLSTAIPFAIIIAVLLIQSRKPVLRAEPVERQPTLGGGRSTPLTVAVTIALIVVISYFLGVNWVEAITVSLIFAILGLSVVVVTGYSGQISFAQFTFAGIGALVAARLSASVGLPFLLCLVAGMLAAAVAGFLFAIPTLRSRGVSLAIVTIGLALSFEAVIFNNTNLNGGFEGIQVKSPTIFGLNVDPTQSPWQYAMVCLVVAAIAGIAVANLRRGTAGRFLIATRDSSQAALSLGINVRAARLFAFTVSAGIAGVGGVLLAFQSPNVFLTPFTFDASVALLVTGTLAGLGYVSGGFGAGLGAIGGLSWYALSLLGGQLYLPLALGVLTLVQIAILPGGLGEVNVHNAERIRRRLGLRSHLVNEIEMEPASDATLVQGEHELAIEGLSARFGGVQALTDVSLRVRSGEVVGLIGPNGAGKTTLIDAVTGANRRYRGAISLDGRGIDKLPSWARARAGLARSFQGLALIDDLSVGENLCVAAEGSQQRGFLRDLWRPRRPKLGSIATAALEAFDLQGDVHRRPDELSYGRRRLVAVARALASGPTIVLLDEPGAGLDTGERRELGRLIGEVARKLGIGVLLVEHDIGLVFSICDHVTVLTEGKVLAAGTPAVIRRDPAVFEAFLGAGHQEAAPPPPAPVPATAEPVQ